MIGCPVFTPFDEFGRVNYSVVQDQCDLIIKKGFDCVLIGGTTGEWALLSVDERCVLIQTWSNCVKKSNLKLIVHVSDPCLANVHKLIAMCRHVGNVYCVALLGRQIFPVEDLESYLIEASDGFPFLYYHFPELYGYNKECVNCLMQQIPNMIGAKIVRDPSQLDFESPDHIFVDGDIISKESKSIFV